MSVVIIGGHDRMERAVCQDSCKNQTKRKRNDDHDRSSKPGDSFCQ